MKENHAFTAGSLAVRVYPGRKEMGAAAAGEIARALRELLAQKEQVNIMLAAAPSQNEALAALREAGGIDWQRVNAFHMDEYVGLEEAHPAGFGNFLRRAILDQLPFLSYHLINGNAADPLAEAHRYAALLREHPLDLCIMGVGENGHLAFNDPSVADFKDPRTVKPVELEEACRRQQVNDGCFASLELVPRQALTVTIPGLMSAGRIFCIVPSAAKADAVGHMLRDEPSETCPATILKTHPMAALYLDRDAASRI